MPFPDYAIVARSDFEKRLVEKLRWYRAQTGAQNVRVFVHPMVKASHGRDIESALFEVGYEGAAIGTSIHMDQDSLSIFMEPLIDSMLPGAGELRQGGCHALR